MKFNFKGKGKAIAKNAWGNTQPILFGTLGVIGSQKFLDFKTMFPNVDPNKFFIKHEGLIKVGAVVLTLSMWHKIPPMLKFVLIGVAIQGGIKAVGQYTTTADGKRFFEQIGAGTFDEQMNKLAEEIKDKSKSDTSVGSPKSDTSVGEVYGMGWSMMEPLYRHQNAA